MVGIDYDDVDVVREEGDEVHGGDGDNSHARREDS